MSARLTLFSVRLFLFAPSAHAHRLNEYLQATTISLTKDSIRLHLHLTAGSDIAPKVLLIIDLNNDGIISIAEQQAYTKLVLKSMYLSIDGHHVPLQIVSSNFSTVYEIKKGIGDIQLYLWAGAIPNKATHHLTFENHLQHTISVYLVNCLLPSDTDILVTGQSRNNDQSLYSLDFTIERPQHSTVADKQSMAKTEKKALIKTFFFQGIRHILKGYDHLLFICALVLGAAGLWDLIKIVTAFTIAHSITLTLATFGLAYLPGYIVEPFISASIIFVAVQNIFWPQHADENSRLAGAFFLACFTGSALPAVSWK